VQRISRTGGSNSRAGPEATPVLALDASARAREVKSAVCDCPLEASNVGADRVHEAVRDRRQREGA
jgi:hypothetical protein